jgi:hypothetical protein
VGDDRDLFRFLEADLSRAGDVETVTCRCAYAGDVLQRAAELANEEWSEEEAGAELARLSTRDALHGAQTRLISALFANRALDLVGIRMTRIIWKALDASR